VKAKYREFAEILKLGMYRNTQMHSKFSILLGIQNLARHNL